MQSNKYFNATMREIRTQKTGLDSSHLPNGEFARLSTTAMKAEIYPTGTPKDGISRIGKVWRRVNPPPYHISIFFCAVNITDSAGTRFMLCARFLVCDK